MLNIDKLLTEQQVGSTNKLLQAILIELVRIGNTPSEPLINLKRTGDNNGQLKNKNK